MKKWEKENLEQELDRIQRFIRGYADEGETVVVAVSGGLDSDVTARLCCRAVGNRRLKLFMVIEDQMEEKFLLNARRLAADLKVSLKEIHVGG